MCEWEGVSYESYKLDGKEVGRSVGGEEVDMPFAA